MTAHLNSNGQDSASETSSVLDENLTHINDNGDEVGNSNSAVDENQNDSREPVLEQKSTEQQAGLKSLIVTLAYSVSNRVRRLLASRKSKGGILYNKVSFREHLTSILLMIPAAATTMLTYYGVSGPMAEQGGDIVAKGQALAFAITIGTFSWLGWFYLFGLIYRLREIRLTTSLIAASLYIGMIGAIDAPFNAMALGGGSAVQMTLVDTAEYYEEQKDIVFRKSTLARKLMPALRAQAKRFRQLETNEIKNGSRTKAKGKGKVSDGFGQIATLLEELVKELENGLAQSKALQSGITSIFADIKRDTYVIGPIRPRVQRVSVKADQIDDLLAELSQYDFESSIQITLDSLKTIFPTPKNATTKLQKIQNAELADIAAMAKPVAEALENGLQKISGDDVAKRDRVRPQSVQQAIYTKWRELLPQWVAAVFIDVAPAILIILLVAAFREAEVLNQDERKPSSKSDHKKTGENS